MLNKLTVILEGVSKKWREVICPFCLSGIKIHSKKHINFINVALSFVASLAYGYLFTWQLNFKFLLLAGFFLLIAEIFVHLRWRLSHICKECGFDPILYKTNPQKASDCIKYQLQKRQNDPYAYLKPPLKIPVKIVTPNGQVTSVRNGDKALIPYLTCRFYQEKKRHSQEKRTPQSQKADAMIATQSRHTPHHQGAQN